MASGNWLPQPSFKHRNIFCLRVPSSFQDGVISPITPMLNLPRLTREVSIPGEYNFVQDVLFWKFLGHRASLPSHFRLGIFTSSTNSYNVVTTRLLKGKETLFKVIQIRRWCVVQPVLSIYPVILFKNFDQLPCLFPSQVSLYAYGIIYINSIILVKQEKPPLITFQLFK